MKRQLWLNLGMASGVGVLAWLVFFKPDATETTQFPLSTLSAPSIQEIVIHPAQKPRLVLSKRSGNWMLTEPFVARADAARIDNLLGLLSATSERKLPVQDLARYELEKPLASVKIGPQEFIFGGAHPLTNQLYVQTQGAVYLISPVYFIEVAKSATDYASKQILSADENPVGFEFAGFKLSRNAGTWHRTPTDDALSQDNTNQFADEWRQARALSVSVPQNFQAKEHITVHLAGGKTLKLQAVQLDHEWAVLRPDENLLYHFKLEVAQALRQPHPKPQPQP